MTDEECRRLATVAIDTWPSGPRGYVWQNDLRELHYLTAQIALRELRHSVDRVTLAAFHRAYQAVRARQLDARRDDLDGPLLGASDPAAVAAFERGLARGRAERAGMNLCRCEWCRTHLGNPRAE